jgi:hypothetical protein
MSFLEIGGFRGTLVILEHSAAMYRLSPALEMYRFRDTRLDDFTIYLSLQTFVQVFSENFEKAIQSGMPIITMPYTPHMAKVLQVCLQKYYNGFLDNWLCASFFHDDADTAKITFANGESPLEYKSVLVNDLLNYPFIKKIEIPYGYLITYPSLYQLIEDSL